MNNYINLFVEVVKKYSDFKSRSNKTEFWMFTLVYIIINFLLSLISWRLSSIFGLILFIPSLAVGVRRLHDIGKSGTNMLWVLLPIIGWIYLILLCLKDSVAETNQWGDVPAEIKL